MQNSLVLNVPCHPPTCFDLVLPSHGFLQLPLMLTPLPNLTVYYTGYRLYSHFRALQVWRCAASWLLQCCMDELFDAQLASLLLHCCLGAK